MEKVWETILDVAMIVSIVMAGVAVGGFIVNVRKEAKLSKTMSQELHEHSVNSNDEHDKTQNLIKDIKTDITCKYNAERIIYENLTKDQSKIADSVSLLQHIPSELSRLNNDNKMLMQQVEHLQKEKERIVFENTQLKTENSRLETENKHLLDKAARLEERTQHKSRSDYTQEL